MDWTKYENIYTYVKHLPEKSLDPVTLDWNSPFEQCVDYPEHPNPIVPTQKTTHETLPINNIPRKQFVITYNLWKQILYRLNIPYSYENYFVRALKNFIMNPIAMSFFGGRRAYPMLEMLDRPKITLEPKHKQAFGYIISFLTNTQLQFENEIYKWTPDVTDLFTITTKK